MVEYNVQKYPPFTTGRLKRAPELPEQLRLFDPGPVPGADLAYLYAGFRHGWIKLGISVDPGRRMYQLGTRLLATTDRDMTFEDEQRMHMLLRRWHIRYEWYHPAPEVLAVVSRFPHQYPRPPDLQMAA